MCVKSYNKLNNIMCIINRKYVFSSIIYISKCSNYVKTDLYIPVNTTFPDTKINNTILGFTIRYISPGNSSGS